MTKTQSAAIAAAIAAVLSLAGSSRATPPPETKKPAAGEKAVDRYEALPYRFIGPPGNRVSAVAGVPGDPNTCYAGGASGGVWKSTDAGVHWKPVLAS